MVVQFPSAGLSRFIEFLETRSPGMEPPGSLNHCFKKWFNTEAVSVPLSRHVQGRPAIPNEINNVQNRKARPIDNWVQNLTGECSTSDLTQP
jgi:hypothetical protein